MHGTSSVLHSASAGLQCLSRPLVHGGPTTTGVRLCYSSCYSHVRGSIQADPHVNIYHTAYIYTPATRKLDQILRREATPCLNLAFVRSGKALTSHPLRQTNYSDLTRLPVFARSVWSLTVSLLLPPDMMASPQSVLSLFILLLASCLLGSVSAPSQDGEFAIVNCCCSCCSSSWISCTLMGLCETNEHKVD